jgi:hypothetical protein
MKLELGALPAMPNSKRAYAQATIPLLEAAFTQVLQRILVEQPTGDPVVWAAHLLLAQREQEQQQQQQQSEQRAHGQHLDEARTTMATAPAPRLARLPIRAVTVPATATRTQQQEEAANEHIAPRPIDADARLAMYMEKLSQAERERAEVQAALTAEHHRSANVPAPAPPPAPRTAHWNANSALSGTSLFERGSTLTPGSKRTTWTDEVTPTMAAAVPEDGSEGSSFPFIPPIRGLRELVQGFAAPVE